MKIVLCSLKIKNSDIDFNLNQILSSMKSYSKKADLLLFGEAFLQGFNGLTWNFEKDKTIAVKQADSSLISTILKAAKQYQIAVAFGYFELFNEHIYSSYLLVNNEGKIAYNYRRQSIGWKESFADNHYCEGNVCNIFTYMGKSFAVSLCGDLWNEDIAYKLSKLNADVLIWPLNRDIYYRKWNRTEKFEYAIKSKKCCKEALVVNSYNATSENYDDARGGALYVNNGEIVSELPAGDEGYLVVEL